MTTMKQTYNLTTNLEYEALYCARVCLEFDIPIAINPAQSDDDDRYSVVIWYNEENADLIMDMDNNLKSGDYEGHGLNFHEFEFLKK